MPVIVNCPFCEAKYNLPDRLAGRRVKCRKCGNKFNTDSASDDMLGGATQDLAAISDASFDFRPASGDTNRMPGTDLGDIVPPPPPPSGTASDFAFEAPPPPAISDAGAVRKSGSDSDIDIEASELARALAGGGHIADSDGFGDDDGTANGDEPGHIPHAIGTESSGESDAADSQGLMPYRPDSVRKAYDSGKLDEYGGTGQFDTAEVIADAKRMIGGGNQTSPFIPPLPPTPAASSPPPAAAPSSAAVPPAKPGPAAPTPVLVLGLLVLIGLIGGGAYLIVTNPLGTPDANIAANRPAIEVADGLNALDTLVAEGAQTPISAVRRYENYLAQSRALNAEFAVRQQALATAMEFSRATANAGNANANPDAEVWSRYRQSAEQYAAFIAANAGALAAVTVEQVGETVATEGEATLTATVAGHSLDIAVGIAAPELVPTAAKYRYTLAKIGTGWHVRARTRVTD